MKDITAPPPTLSAPSSVPLYSDLDPDSEGPDLSLPPPKSEAKKAQEEREDAYHKVHTWNRYDEESDTWQPYALHPCSLDRWTWWHRLELHNAAVPQREWFGNLNEAHLPTAWSLLFLLSHSPERILHHVANPQVYWYAVNQWAAIHCPPESWEAALILMREIEMEAKALITIERNTGKRRGRPGNAQSPWITRA